MQDSSLPETNLLKTVLEPLLDDFKYWFGRSLELLESEQLTFMSPEQQSDLILRVRQAAQEVYAASVLFDATDGKVGVDMAILMPWHQLLAECWRVSMRFHQDQKVN